LDGIDLDLHYFDKLKQINHDLFMVFLEEASAAWHQAGLLVSVALDRKGRLYSHAYDWVDRVNLMAYDMVEESIEFHASLPATKVMVEFLWESGCPPSKIILGIPFYARNSQEPHLALTFAELYDEMVGETGNAKDLVYTYEGYQWDSPQSMQKKVDYGHEKGLGGIFVADVGQDKQTVEYPGGLLLQSVSEYMSHVNKEKEKESTEL
jgi:GH18 family chitinase